MRHLYTIYFSVVLIVALLCIVIGWFIYLRGNATSLDQLTREAVTVVEELELNLRQKPVDQWWQLVDSSYARDRYYVEFSASKDFSKPTLSLLGSGHTDSSVDDDGFPFAQRFVVGTDQIVMVSFRDSVLGNDKVDNFNNLLIALLAMVSIPIFFAMLILRPLTTRIASLERSIRNVADGNFSSRVPEAKDAVGHLGVSFNKMAQRIQALVNQNKQLLDDQREMLRAVAHEFRGPMARIRFALDMSEDAGDKPTPELNHEMGTGLDDLDKLVGEVLSYTRLQPGTPMLNIEPVSIDDVVEDAMSHAQLDSDSVTIEPLTRNTKDVRVAADPYYLQRAVLNLLNNAARHAKSKVIVDWFVEEDTCWLNVDDDGPGVPMIYRSKIFEPFVRVDTSRSRNSGGAGLGLAIVQRIIEKHGGKAVIEDSPKLGGARFVLSWPKTPEIAVALPQ